MSFLTLANKFRAMAAEIRANRENSAIQTAMEAAALIRNRVQNEKVNAQGQSFGQYSETPVPKYFYYGKSLSGGAEDKVRKGKFELSYNEFRDINNLNTGDINFTFTGDTWRNVGVEDVQNSEDSTTVIIGGMTQRSKDILEWQSEAKGEIIALNEQELQFVVEAQAERIIDVIRRYLK